MSTAMPTCSILASTPTSGFSMVAYSSAMPCLSSAAWSADGEVSDGERTATGDTPVVVAVLAEVELARRRRVVGGSWNGVYRCSRSANA